ncbi:MAG: hypothetical protein H0T65_14485 [Deltaproteobacteria bacterium]|nr:hypothetical protein [Deltaproteobacteria bacterium]
MKAEATGIAQSYKTRFEDLNARGNSIMQRGNAIGVTSPDAANASRLFAMAKGKLEQLKADAENAPGEIGKVKERIEMQRFIDRKNHEFEEGFTQINADFDAVESWITLAESRPTQVSSRQPAVPPPPTPGQNTPPPPGNPTITGAGGTTPNPPR